MPQRIAFQDVQRAVDATPPAAQTGAPEMQAVQTFADVAVQSTPDATAQAAWPTPADTVQTSTEESSVQMAGPPAPGAAPAGAGALPTDLDELARRLFDPLAARLKAELWLDRERAGNVLELYR